MNCLKLGALYQYLEGGLSAEQAKQIEGHLRVCAKCRRAAEERRLIAAAASSLAPFDVPENFPERVMTRLPQSPPRRQGWFISLAAGISVLTLISAVLIASGKSGLELLRGVGDSFWGSIRTAAVLMAKAAAFVSLAGRTLRTLFEAGAKGLSVLTSLVHPGIQAFILLLALGILATLFYGLRKKLTIGD